MSQTYLSVVLAGLAYFLPRLGINIGSEELTTTVQTIVMVISGLWILVRRYQAGDVNVIGVRKS